VPLLQFCAVLAHAPETGCALSQCWSMPRKVPRAYNLVVVIASVCAKRVT
jgi:hypothetical protein